MLLTKENYNDFHCMKYDYYMISTVLYDREQICVLPFSWGRLMVQLDNGSVDNTHCRQLFIEEFYITHTETKNLYAHFHTTEHVFHWKLSYDGPLCRAPANLRVPTYTEINKPGNLCLQGHKIKSFFTGVNIYVYRVNVESSFFPRYMRKK